MMIHHIQAVNLSSLKNTPDLSIHHCAEPLKPQTVCAYRIVLPEREPGHVDEIVPNGVSHQSPGGQDEICADPGTALPDIPVRFFQLGCIQVEQQGAIVIEDRSSAQDLLRVVIDKHSKIPQVSVHIQDKRIQYTHTTEGISIPDFFIVGQ